MINDMVILWKNRKKYSTLAEMPSFLLIILGFSSFLITTFFGSLFYQVFPEYLEVANSLPFFKWGIVGWCLSFILFCFFVMTWLFGSLAKVCNSIIVNRWFK